MTVPHEILARRNSRRNLVSRSVIFLLVVLSVIAVIPLLSIFFYVLGKGIAGINWAFFTQIPAPIGEPGGGMANAIVGSLKILGVAALMGIPWGVAVGFYLAEFGEEGKFAETVRLIIDLLASAPSIVVGLFAYAAIVVPMGKFSAYAGAFALTVIMLPIIARSTEEVVKRVPNSIREAGLALGLPRWKVISNIVARTSMAGIITSVILAIARVSGETAPLLFTAFNNQFWSSGLDNPTASLPVQIYTYAISPFEEWHQQAWAGALVLIMFVLVLNLATRLIFSQQRVE